MEENFKDDSNSDFFDESEEETEESDYDTFSDLSDAELGAQGRSDSYVNLR